MKYVKDCYFSNLEIFGIGENFALERFDKTTGTDD